MNSHLITVLKHSGYMHEIFNSLELDCDWASVKKFISIQKMKDLQDYTNHYQHICHILTYGPCNLELYMYLYENVIRHILYKYHLKVFQTSHYALLEKMLFRATSENSIDMLEWITKIIYEDLKDIKLDGDTIYFRNNDLYEIAVRNKSVDVVNWLQQHEKYKLDTNQPNYNLYHILFSDYSKEMFECLYFHFPINSCVLINIAISSSNPEILVEILNVYGNEIFNKKSFTISMIENSVSSDNKDIIKVVMNYIIFHDLLEYVPVDLITGWIKLKNKICAADEEWDSTRHCNVPYYIESMDNNILEWMLTEYSDIFDKN